MVEIVVSIVLKNDNVLIVKRAKKEGELQWQFPGGTVEPGEHSSQTAIRELKEETGISGEIIELIGERVHPYTKKSMAYYAVRATSEALSINDDDLCEVKWVSKTELCSYFTTPLYDKVIEYLNL